MGLLERDAVLGRLQELVDAARDGVGKVALIRGGAGIGKTSVARELKRRSVSTAHVLFGACDDLLAERPLGPVWDMAEDEPALAEAVASADRDRVYQTFRELFARKLRPTVAVFEDVHWADGATLDLLTSLGRRMEGSHALLVLTFRDQVPVDHPLSVTLGDLPQAQVEQVAIEPLSRDTVLALTEDPRQGARIWDLSKGNPFYVFQLVATPPGEVPLSVTDMIHSRLARLSPKARRLVELVSIVPGRMETGLLDEVDQDLIEAIDDADDARLLEMAGGFVAFRHELARSAVEASLSERVRRALNKSVLAACEQLDLDVARSAHFAIRAQDIDSMVRQLPQAATEAARASSHREALTYLEALEPYLDQLPADRRADIYELWASEQQLVTGEGLHYALAAVEIRQQEDAKEPHGRSLLLASQSAWKSKDVPMAVELNEAAIALLEEVGGEILAQAYADRSRLKMHNDRQEESREDAERALRLAPGPSRARAEALIAVGIDDNFVNYPAGVAPLREALGISQALGLDTAWQRAITNLIWGALRWEPIDAARMLNEEALAGIHEETAALVDFHRALGAIIAFAAGRYTAAESTLRDLDGAAASREVVPIHLAGLLVRMGDPDAAEALERARTQMEALGQQGHLIDLGIRWAEYVWAFQRPDPAATQRHLSLLDTAALAIDRTEIGLWLWLDGHIESMPSDAVEPLAWLSDGRWEKVAAWYQERGRPYEQAVALNLGDVNARLEALAIVDRIGAKALAAQIRRALRSEGVKGVPRGPVEATQQIGLGLTLRQAEVLAHLSEGLSNAEIGRRLFISPRTVEKHVAALLNRLGVSDRHEAAVIARSRAGHSGPEGWVDA